VNQVCINELCVNLIYFDRTFPASFQEDIVLSRTVARDDGGNILPGGIGRNWFVADDGT
jgi:hypothetical protein